MALEEDVWMTRAVPAFPQLCIYLLKEQRTPLQTFKWLSEFIVKHSLEEEDFEKYFSYLLMASCADGNRKSKMSIMLTGRITISANQAEFCAKRLQGTLGNPGPQTG